MHVACFAQCPSQQPCRQEPEEELLRECSPLEWGEGGRGGFLWGSPMGSQRGFKAICWDPPSSSTSLLAKWEIASKEVFIKGYLNISQNMQSTF